MTRILWHSVFADTGYGNQAKTWCRYLRDQGHEVALSTCYGLRGKLMEWEGMRVFPPPAEGRGDLLLRAHAKAHKAELIILLYDLWMMDPRQVKDWPTLAWVACDGSRIGQGDLAFLSASGAVPVAISNHTAGVLRKAGYADPLTIPHGIDTVEVYRPPESRQAARFTYGLEDSTFAIGINSNNIDRERKAYPEQFAAFARFHRKHPDSRLFVHTIADLSANGSLNLSDLADYYEITDAVSFADQYTILAGGYEDEDMATWYGAMDVVSNPSLGEGFGLVAIEAQACGTPVILSRNTTGPQLSGPGWLVRCQDHWNPVHAAAWGMPFIDSIVKAYERAYARKDDDILRGACRKFAEAYDIARVGPLWDSAVARMA